MITTDISIYDKNSISATFFRTTSAIDVKDVYTSFILTVADNNFNLMKKRRPTKERPVMACLLQPHIDLYSRFELNHVLLIMGGDPLD